MKGAQFLVQWKVQMKGVLFLSVNGIYKSKLGWTSERGFPNETLLSSPLLGVGGGGGRGGCLSFCLEVLPDRYCLDSKRSKPQEKMSELIPIQSQ